MTSIVMNQNAILFIYLIIGFSSVKFNWIKENQMPSLSNLLTNVALPFAILISFQSTFSEEMRKIWIGCCTFSNILFIGIPIVGELYGSKGLIILVIYNTISSLFLFTIGIKLYSGNMKGKMNCKGFLSTPVIIASLGGFILFISNIHIPNPFYSAFQTLGNLTAPLSGRCLLM
ncbi:hypothetical protein FA950_28910 [Bacillus thuringiensis]|uniref:AEC family transporter n=1 Tax=Bacillus thuringiensis TaxID=1428 RepID=UPI0010AB96F1|nr:AEC family transporter [Bacillus thuringiensis]TKA00078.1 hypothetical protein FA950_28910 [Bacillus thuringiensis]